MQINPASQMSTGAAAAKLNVTSQTIRNWVRSGRLSGSQMSAGRLRVDAASVERLLSDGGDGSGATGGATQSLEATLADIRRALEDLRSRDLAATRLLEAVERERDRFRAESAALRDASLQLVSAASETDAGVRSLLEVLERQREALVQLLAPGSPEDLAR